MNFNGMQFPIADFHLAACCLLTRSFYLILCTCFIYEMQTQHLYAKEAIDFSHTLFLVLFQFFDHIISRKVRF